jgi:hypothetical protein
VPVPLLRAALQAGGSADPSPECLDAETIAAWADDTLGRHERRAAEAHAADCGRCQALVAAMAQTAPPATSRPWWRTPAMGWLVPLTVAAAALLVWINVPRAPGEPSSTLVSTAVSTAPEQEPRRPPADAALARPPDVGLPPSAAPAAAPVTGHGETKVASGRTERAAGDRSSSAPVTRSTAPSEAAAGVAPAPAPSMAVSANAVPPPQPDQVDRIAAGSPSPVAVQRNAAAQLESANARNLLLQARRLPMVVVSTNPASQWRILANGTVQHSTDGGATWEMQPTGVTAMLTAGASPAPSICWLVGPQGMILLSTDGRSWRRVAFPESDDLTSVHAIDDKSATVTTSGGRAFSTSDGGRTWQR